MTSSTIKLALLSAPHPAFCHLQCRKASQVTESWGGARKQGYRTVYVEAHRVSVCEKITHNTTHFHKYRIVCTTILAETEVQLEVCSANLTPVFGAMQLCPAPSSFLMVNGDFGSTFGIHVHICLLPSTTQTHHRITTSQRNISGWL